MLSLKLYFSTNKYILLMWLLLSNKFRLFQIILTSHQPPVHLFIIFICIYINKPTSPPPPSINTFINNILYFSFSEHILSCNNKKLNPEVVLHLLLLLLFFSILHCCLEQIFKNASSERVHDSHRSNPLGGYNSTDTQNFTIPLQSTLPTEDDMKSSWHQHYWKK